MRSNIRGIVALVFFKRDSIEFLLSDSLNHISTYQFVGTLHRLHVYIEDLNKWQDSLRLSKVKLVIWLQNKPGIG